MHEPERVIFTNMVMVSDGQGNVLVQQRRDPSWPGGGFPRGTCGEGGDLRAVRRPRGV